MSKVRVCFLGTPEFAAISLRALLEDEHYEVVGVITQPDKPAGRKLQLLPTPVKLMAQAKGLKVLSPDLLKENTLLFDEVKSWKAEVAVVVAYGQILPESFLQIFPFGAVNVHASLLPRWRGAAPIQRAIESGDKQTGVCLQRMVKRLDAGDVFGIRQLEIDSEINSLELRDQLAPLGADLLKIELMDYIRGNLVPTPQDENCVTYAKKILKSESLLDWRQTAESLQRKIRAFAWGPGVYTVLSGKKIKIHKATVLSENTKFEPGTVVDIQENGFSVQTAAGLLHIVELQPESRSRMKVADFFKGYTLPLNSVFESREIL